ncbi:MAG: V-type ATPase subunit [Dehalococcoidia bacterium]|nr:V-type ATPase subunit [Dehalococcoidia bacterium]
MNTKSAFSSGYLKGEEAKLVSSEHIEGLLRASNNQDVLGVISDTDVGSYLEGVPLGTFADIDQALWGYIHNCIGRMEQFGLLPDDMLKILRAYVVKYDVLNIKSCLWNISSEKKARLIPLGVIYNSGALDRLFAAEDIGGIVAVLTECKLGTYAGILTENEKRLSGVGKGRLGAEARLDNEYYRSMLEVTSKVRDRDVFAKSFGLIADLANLKLVLRTVAGGLGVETLEGIISGGNLMSESLIKELLTLKLNELSPKLTGTPYLEVVQGVVSSYDKTKNPAVIEGVIEKHRFRLLKGLLSPRVMSPLMMIWYLLLKEIEIRNLRIIFKGIIDGVPGAEMKDYLVLAS